MPRSELLERAPAGAGLALVACAVLVMIVRPAGKEDASAAAREAIGGRAKSGSLTVLAVQRWGEGALTLTGFDARDGSRRLAFGFAVDRGRGWRMVASTVRRAELTDVRVGSLLVTTSAGGAGQPAWSAVYGELGEPRISRVEVQWESGSPATEQRTDSNAYLVVREGVLKPVLARYLAADGMEIAKVPVV